MISVPSLLSNSFSNEENLSLTSASFSSSRYAWAIDVTLVFIIALNLAPRQVPATGTREHILFTI
jgi:hypothetical protein